MASTSHCVHCSKIVTSRMHAVQCDVCDRWQHRKCKTGVSAAQYKKMVEDELHLTFRCNACRMDVDDRANSTGDITPPEMDVSTSPIRVLSTTYIVRAADEDDAGDQSASDDLSTTINQSASVAQFASIDQSSSVAQSADVIEDRTFNLSDRNFDHPHVSLNDSIPDRPLNDEVPVDAPVTYEVVEGGSKRGGRKLISGDGYTYTARRCNGGRTYWTCSIRSKKMTCHASVKQFRDIFTPSIAGHVHPADPGAAKKVKIATKVKEVARERVFEPASKIVERVMKEMTTSDDISLPKPDNLTRAANHHRRQRRTIRQT